LSPEQKVRLAAKVEHAAENQPGLSRQQRSRGLLAAKRLRLSLERQKEPQFRRFRWKSPEPKAAPSS
jgi:hypothetical protein